MPVLSDSGIFEPASLDDSARSVLHWSVDLASHFGTETVRLNHLFLAFLEQREALEACVNEVLHAVLKALGTRQEWVDSLPLLQVKLTNRAPLAVEPAKSAEALRLSEDLRGVLDRAGSLATRLGDGRVGAKHLLISLFSDELRQFREKFLSAGSTVLLEEARGVARGMVEAARTDATRIVQTARREADKILDRAETDALRTEMLVKTKEEIVRQVGRRAKGLTLPELGERLGVSWQSLVWPCRQLVQEGRLSKEGRVYLPFEPD